MGSGNGGCKEALDRLASKNIGLNYCRVKAFPFGEEVKSFIKKHELIYVVEQNRDAQLKTLLMLDIEANPDKLVSLLHYNGMPLNAGVVVESVLKEMAKARAA